MTNILPHTHISTLSSSLFWLYQVAHATTTLSAELLTLALGRYMKTEPRRQKHPGSLWAGKRSIDPSINLYLL